MMTADEIREAIKADEDAGFASYETDDGTEYSVAWADIDGAHYALMSITGHVERLYVLPASYEDTGMEGATLIDEWEVEA